MAQSILHRFWQISFKKYCSVDIHSRATQSYQNWHQLRLFM